jgi:hypothetical protein
MRSVRRASGLVQTPQGPGMYPVPALILGSERTCRVLNKCKGKFSTIEDQSWDHYEILAA